jgi:hypothetical protein
MARRPPTVVPRDAADEPGANDGAGAIDVALGHQTAAAAAGAGWGSGRSCSADNDGVRALKFGSLAFERPGRLTEGDVVPAARLGMRETELFVGRGDDADDHFGQVARFVWRDGETERRRVDDDETVAAIGDVDLERA